MPRIIPLSRPDAPELEPYRQLTNPHILRQAGLFAAEGRFVVERLVDRMPARVESLLVTPGGLEALAGTFERLPADTPVYVAPRAVTREIVGYVFHRGCLALGRRHPELTPESVFARDPATMVLLEGVTDPDNVGSIFRSSLALGGEAVLLTSRSADPFYRKTIRTSMGAVFQLPWARCGDGRETVEALRAAGWLVVALTPDAEALPVGDIEVPEDQRLMLLAGSEGDGLSGELLRAADLRLRVPMRAGADSLNVAVATAIALATLRPDPGLDGR